MERIPRVHLVVSRVARVRPEVGLDSKGSSGGEGDARVHPEG